MFHNSDYYSASVQRISQLRAFWSDIKNKIGAGIVLQTLLLLAGFVWFRKTISTVLFPPEQVYHSAFFTLSALFEIKIFLVFLLLGLLDLFSHKRLDWQTLSFGRPHIIFLCIIAFPIVWELSLYDVNIYYDQIHFLDRMLLILAAVLIFRHPLFAVLFICLAFLNLHQFAYPFGEYLTTGIRPSYDILCLFSVFLFLRLIFPLNTLLFFVLAITIHASNYFIPGAAKLEISPSFYEWLLFNRLDNFVISAYLNGWAGFLSEPQILSVAQAVKPFNFPLQFFTLTLQVGALFLLYSRRISLLFFIGFEILHLGIFLFSGVFFWTWIIVNLSFIYLIKYAPPATLEFFYNKKSFLLSIGVILLSPNYYMPIALGWFDTNFNTIYDLYVQTESGQRFKINRNEMSPYDAIFTQNRLYAIDSSQTLSHTYGTFNREIFNFSNAVYLNSLSGVDGKTQHKRLNTEINSSGAQDDSFSIYQKLLQAKTPREADNLLETFGISQFNPVRRYVFEHFLTNYFRNLNRREHKKYFFSRMGAPYHIYDLTGTKYTPHDKIVKLEAYRTHYFYDGEQIHSFEKEKLMQITIDGNKE